MRPRRIIFGARAYVMGVVNVTPDSFSDGGLFLNKDRAVARALALARDGADFIDIGGESTRPGAKTVEIDREIARVVPVIEAISRKTSATISIDTRKSEVAEAALKAGASIVNDVSGLRYDPRIANVAAKYGAKVIIMHMKGTPGNMQAHPAYRNVIREIKDFLRASISIARRAGLGKRDIIVDPGIGFGKTVKHNLTILNRLREFRSLGYPICIGTSRKSFIGKILGIGRADRRLVGTIATVALAVANGADIVRVHDVIEARQAASIAASVAHERIV